MSRASEIKKQSPMLLEGVKVIWLVDAYVRYDCDQSTLTFLSHQSRYNSRYDNLLYIEDIQYVYMHSLYKQCSKLDFGI